KELGVSDTVAKQLTSVPDDFRIAARIAYEAAGIDVSRSRFSGNELRRINEIQAPLIVRAVQEIEQMLSPEQLLRLKQIRVQMWGIEAFRVPDIASELMLSDDQKRQINDLTRTYLQRAFVGLPKKGERTAEELEKRNAKRDELNKERDNQTWNVLTKEQQS